MNYSMRWTGSVVSLGILLVTAVLPPGAVAEETRAVIEEIVVTAQKREQSQQDVPISIAAFTGEMVERVIVKSGVWALDQAALL